MALTFQSGTLAVLICLVVTSLSSAHRCDSCKEGNALYPGCLAVCGPKSTHKKRNMPSDTNFGAFIQDQVMKRGIMSSDTCDLEDVYLAVPPSCYEKLDWLVLKAQEAVLAEYY
ncbi:uncharacterized protein LOC110976032 [Acanthaster planci]|uniref:Uncharacterized protein LOC110976032 n=1 Tax=Acanthaster planci TaxID=133434 RepID=A0A8B7XWN2_ACAPL|nr:uncharacterized protein LOC110976032 [Acanthaster planci]XP_022084662.1 uncharacterized protein LOC110976032 [Acanthaster planci]